jgi:phytol kinase
MAFCLAAAYFLVLFSAIELLARKKQLPIELSRKMAHILAGISAAFLPLIMPFAHIVALALLFLAVMLISLNRKIFMSIHDVRRRSYGELFFPLAIASTALLFPDQSLYMYGILIMAVSDGLAGLLGSWYGKATYRLGWAHKSYFGSIVFFISALAIGVLFSQGYVIVLATLTLTLVEAISARGVDNILLPLVAALCLSLL